MVSKIETREINIIVKITIPCDVTSVDLTTLQITPNTNNANKFIKKLARLCNKYGYQTIVTDDGNEKTEVKNG